MKKLTVIIPFLNEGEEVLHTVKSIRQTVGDTVNILLVNDASQDGYAYEQVARDWDALYICHDTRKGVAASRDEAIKKCPTEFFLLLDAHMRFYQSDWDQRIVQELEKDPRCILCCQCLKLSKDRQGEEPTVSPGVWAYGAYIDFRQNGGLNAQWSAYDPDPDKTVVEIPCILGAGYACNKTYWQYVGGLEGLRSYGVDEQLISLKVWLEGGTCKLLKQVKIGHIFRKTFPYKVGYSEIVYNKLWVAHLLLPPEDKYNVCQTMESENKESYDWSMREFVAIKDQVRRQQAYYKRIFTRPVQAIIQYNKDIQQKAIQFENNISQALSLDLRGG